MKYFDAIRQQGNRHGNIREVPGFLDASERVRQRFQREGRSEGRVHHGSSKGPRNEDLICEKCGKMTFGFKKTDRCYSCYAVRVKWNVAATSGDGICGLRWLLKDLFIEALEWYWRLFSCIWIGAKWLCWRPMAFTELPGCAVSVWLDDDNEDAVNVVSFVLLLTWFLWRNFGVDYDGFVGFFSWFDGVVRKTNLSRHSEVLAFFRDLMTLSVLSVCAFSLFFKPN